MLDVLPEIGSFLLDCLTKIFNLYTTSSIFAAFFALWVLDQVLGLFDFLRK